MNASVIIRFGFILVLWLVLCYLLLTRSAKIDFMVIFYCGCTVFFDNRIGNSYFCTVI